MKVETSITPRDLKLITVVGSIAIVIVCVWAAIQPLWETHEQLQDQVSDAQERLQQATDPSLAAGLEDDAQTVVSGLAQGPLAGYQTGVMNASQANALATDLAGSYNLSVVDVSFALPAQGSFAAEPSYSAGGSDAQSASSGSSSSPSAQNGAQAVQMGQGAQPADTGDLTGIYQTNFQIVLSGSRDDLQKFLNDMAQNRAGMRVQQFQWTAANVNGASSAATASSDQDSWHLAVNLAVYSYQG